MFNNITWRLISEGIQNSLFYMLFPFITLYLSSSWGATTASITITSISALSVILGIYSGSLADRFGRSKLIIFTSSGFFISTLLFITGRLYDLNIMVCISFALISMAYSSYVPVGRTYFADWLAEKEQKKVFVISYQMFNVAVVIGPLIGSFVFDSLPVYFIIISIFSTLLLIYISIYKTPEHENFISLSVNTDEKINVLKSITVMFIDRKLLLFIIGSIFAAQAFMQLELLLPAKMVHEFIAPSKIMNFTINPTQYYASILMINGILVVVLGSVFVKISSYYNYKIGFVLSSLLYGMSMLLFAFSKNYMSLIISILIFTIAELLIASTQDSYIAKIAPINLRARYFAAANLRFSISRILAPQFLMLVPIMGYSGGFVVSSIFALFSAIIFLILFQVFHRNLPNEFSNSSYN